MWQRPFQAQDEAERQHRLDAQDFDNGRRSRWIFVGGLVILAIWAVIAYEGLPGIGAILVPTGLGMAIFGGLEILLNR